MQGKRQAVLRRVSRFKRLLCRSELIFFSLSGKFRPNEHVNTEGCEKPHKSQPKASRCQRRFHVRKGILEMVNQSSVLLGIQNVSTLPIYDTLNRYSLSDSVLLSQNHPLMNIRKILYSQVKGIKTATLFIDLD